MPLKCRLTLLLLLALAATVPMPVSAYSIGELGPVIGAALPITNRSHLAAGHALSGGGFIKVLMTDPISYGQIEVFHSATGSTWTSVETIPSFHGMAEGGGKILIVGADLAYLSSDGIQWTAHPRTGPTKGLTYYDGHFYGILGDSILTSADGLNWQTVSTFRDPWVSRLLITEKGWVAWSEDYGTSRFSFSPDGEHWHSIPAFEDYTEVAGLGGIAYLNGRFLVQVNWHPWTLQRGNLVSEDGLNWRPVPAPTVEGRSLVAQDVVSYGGRFLALRSERQAIVENNHVFTSTNGLVWEPLVAPWTGRASRLSCGPSGVAFWAPTFYGESTPGYVAQAVESPLSILRQPALILREAGTLEIGVEALGQRGRTYQWYEGAAPDVTRPVLGATGAQVITPLAVLAEKSLWVRVTDESGSLDSLPFVASPAITHRPLPSALMVSTGDPLAIPVDFQATEPVDFQWFRDGQALDGAVSAGFEKNVSELNDAGVYHFEATLAGVTEASKPVKVQLVTAAALPHHMVAHGSAWSITQPHAGAELHFLWSKDGVPLADVPGEVEGSHTPELRLMHFGPDDEGDYHCTITNGISSMQGVTQRLLLPAPPRLLQWQGDQLMRQGVAMDAYPEVDGEVTHFEFEGRLPPGLGFDPQTGAISGIASVAGYYRFRVRAVNAEGSSQWMDRVISVLPAVPDHVGTYSGLVGRLTVDDPGFGGAFHLTLSRSGAFTGSIDIGSRRYRFKSRLDLQSGEAQGDFYFFHRLVKLRLQLLNATFLTGTVSAADDSWSLVIEAHRLESHRRSWVPDSWRGRHPVDLLRYDPQESWQVAAQRGWLNVTPQGRYRWAGKLPDGTAFTMAGGITSEGMFAARTLLYQKTGSLQGWQSIYSGAPEGTLDWWKRATPGRRLPHPAGVPLQTLWATGQALLQD